VSADPYDHVSINAILYTPRGKLWAMTERGRNALKRSAVHLGVGPSGLTTSAGRLVIDINEWTVPLPRPLRGRVTVELGPVFDDVVALDDAERHIWRPIAPCARAEVAFNRPASNWRGSAYVDMNAGGEPLETGFERWTWARFDGNEATRIVYDARPRRGAARLIARQYNRDGSSAGIPSGRHFTLPRTGWLVSRGVSSPDGTQPRVLRTLEDTPFYSRSLLAFDRGERAIHESVDLERFASRWVQALLPFRMPRRR